MSRAIVVRHIVLVTQLLRPTMIVQVSDDADAERDSKPRATRVIRVHSRVRFDAA